MSLYVHTFCAFITLKCSGYYIFQLSGWLSRQCIHLKSLWTRSFINCFGKISSNLQFLCRRAGRIVRLKAQRWNSWHWRDLMWSKRQRHVHSQALSCFVSRVSGSSSRLVSAVDQSPHDVQSAAHKPLLYVAVSATNTLKLLSPKTVIRCSFGNEKDRFFPVCDFSTDVRCVCVSGYPMS